MRKWLLALALLLLATPAMAQQQYTGAGEAKTVCSIWDATDRALVDASGNLQVLATQSGTWTVTGAGGTFPVTGTFWQATQPVSGTFWQATQPVSGTVTVTDGAGALNVIVDSSASIAVTGPLTDTQLRATPVPVSGTVTANAGSGTFVVGDGAGALNTIIDSMPSVTIGTFPDNEPINVAQINGVATAMGVGVSSTGTQRVMPATTSDIVSQGFSYTTAQTDAAIVTVSAGTRIVVTSYVVVVSEATTVGTAVRIGCGTSTTPATGAAAMLFDTGGFVPGSGANEQATRDTPLLVCADDADIRITSGVPTSGRLSGVIRYTTF